MTAESRDPDIRRVSAEIVERLRSRGVEVADRETPEELVRLLDAVEAFERTVERHGGDLMVDEGLGSAQATEPDASAFVLPARRADESVAGYIERIGAARTRAARVRSQS